MTSCMKHQLNTEIQAWCYTDHFPKFYDSSPQYLLGGFVDFLMSAIMVVIAWVYRVYVDMSALLTY